MASSSADLLEGFLRPSEDEERYYFCGLAGSPRLIAKTSTTPWKIHTDTDSPAKRIATVGDHHIVHTWCPELRAGIVRALSEPGLEWDCFCPIRIGVDKHSARNPVVLLVCLVAPKQGPQPWEPAMRAALRCRALLQEYKVHDVEVEMKQSRFVPMASSATAALASCIDWTYSQELPVAGSRDLDMAEINGYVMPLLPFPGCRVEQEKGRSDEPDAAAGTMGLYLRLAHTEHTEDAEQPAPPDAIYGLTSRHVAVGKRVAAGQDLRWLISHDNNCSLRMLTGGPSCVYQASADLNYADRLMKALLRISNNPDNPHKRELHDMHRASIGYVEELQNALKQVEEADSTQRTLGTVAYSPGHGVGTHGNFKDWALVQMADADRGGLLLSNKVYMAERVTDAMFRAELAAAVDPNQLSSFALSLDADGFLQLHGRDMPPQPPFTGDNRTSHLVAKRGQTTGLRYGITNEIEAVRRTPFGREEPLVSLHLLVVDFVGGHFAEPGDSGSSVFDCTGRVMGIVDGGDVNTGENSSPDVTFVTPIQWILEDMREFTGCEPEICDGLSNSF